MVKTLKTVQKYVLFTFLLLYPILFVPAFLNIFETPKLLLLIISSLVLALLKLAEFVVAKKITFNFSKSDFLVLLLAVAYLLSGLLINPSRMDSFFNPGTSSFVIFSAVVYFFVNQLEEKDKKTSVAVLITSAVLLSVFQLIAFSGVLKSVSFLPQYLKGDVFTPFGNFINSTLFIVLMLPLAIAPIMNTASVKNKVLSVAASFFLIINLFISIYLMLPGKPTSFQQLSYKNSWLVAIDSLKQNFWGVGSGNYTVAFLRSKPLEINLSDKWAAVYQQGAGTVFTVFTELGIIGAVLFLAVIATVIKKSSHNSKPKFISLLLVSLAILLLPFTYVFFPILFYILALNSHTQEKTWEFEYSKFLALPFAAFVIYIAYLFGTVFFADMLFFKSVTAALKSDGKTSYNTLNKALSINPRVDNYHLVLAQIDLNLAQNLSQKETLEEKDKQDIAALVQQAVSEGKAAVSLNPNKASNWEALGDIYQSIIPYAKGAEGFAIQSYNQAIAFNPLSPTLRLKLGGIYYNFGRYEDAVDIFKLAVASKNNLPNAHYNLAAAYRENKQTDKAIAEMEAVLNLVAKDSPDYQKASEELTALKTKKAQPETENTENLQLPQEPQEPVITPPVEVEPVETPQPEVVPQP